MIEQDILDYIKANHAPVLRGDTIALVLNGYFKGVHNKVIAPSCKDPFMSALDALTTRVEEVLDETQPKN